MAKVPSGVEVRFRKDLTKKGNMPARDIWASVIRKRNDEHKKKNKREKIFFNRGQWVDSPAKPFYFIKPTTLDSMYNPKRNVSYLHQVFNVHALLGEGSFGRVHGVTMKRNKKPFAIKVSTISSYYLNQEVHRWELLEHHPYILDYFQSWRQGDKIYIMIELGQSSLGEYKSLHYRVPEAEQWDIFLDVICALSYMQANHMAHLDIKADNIIIGMNGVYKLGDMGSMYHGTQLQISLKSIAFFTRDLLYLSFLMVRLTSDIVLSIECTMLHEKFRTQPFREEYLQDLEIDMYHILCDILSHDSTDWKLPMDMLEIEVVKNRLAIRDSKPRVNHYAIWKKTYVKKY